MLNKHILREHRWYKTASSYNIGQTVYFYSILTRDIHQIFKKSFNKQNAFDLNKKV